MPLPSAAWRLSRLTSLTLKFYFHFDLKKKIKSISVDFYWFYKDQTILVKINFLGDSCFIFTFFILEQAQCEMSLFFFCMFHKNQTGMIFFKGYSCFIPLLLIFDQAQYEMYFFSDSCTNIHLCNSLFPMY